MEDEQMNQMPMLNQNLINSSVISPNYLNNLGPEGTLNLSDNQDIQNQEMEYMTDSDIEDPKYMPTEILFKMMKISIIFKT